MSAPRAIAVVGCTATGKSDLAERIALLVDGEIVSADSMQVYRGMDIGTAKVPLDERRVPYHCIDLVEPGEPYSAARFQADARAAIREIERRGKVPVICGGTGLYVRAALDAMEFPAGEQEGNEVRDRYRAIADEVGPEGLHRMLSERDPQSAQLIHPNNVRRVIRAFELLEEGGTTYAEQHAGLSSLAEFIPALYIGLDVERTALVSQIEKRVDLMVRNGLADEIEGLLAKGLRGALTAPQAIGYKELVVPVEQGLGPGDEAFDAGVSDIKTATRRYAKRQRTWFKKDVRIAWHERNMGDPDALDRVAEQVVVRWSDAQAS